MSVYRVGEKFRVRCKRNARNESIRKWYAVYQCGCGKKFISRCEDIINKETQSCGCQRRSAFLKSCVGNKHNIKHGKTKTREYKIWSMMKERCLKPSHKSFNHYGGRGIKICQQWIESFETFITDMGYCPDGMSIERKNTHGHYEKNNCIWATSKQQARNKRSNRLIDIDGVKKPLVDWVEEIGVVDYSTVHARLRRGWDAMAALTTPINQRGLRV